LSVNLLKDFVCIDW